MLVIDEAKAGTWIVEFSKANQMQSTGGGEVNLFISQQRQEQRVSQT
jgi:hypothetical protein